MISNLTKILKLILKKRGCNTKILSFRMLHYKFGDDLSHFTEVKENGTKLKEREWERERYFFRGMNKCQIEKVLWEWWEVHSWGIEH